MNLLAELLCSFPGIPGSRSILFDDLVKTHCGFKIHKYKISTILDTYQNTHTRYHNKLTRLCLSNQFEATIC
ncbi:hypothetical protein PAHAL_4G136100 [Panicum hallii]|uniref:Uncharacterized protein n=1 Tax=Panicum hallii TaxID=206008 RepID=A0A2S3HJC6_9POAL|nr:hypothetical protein PAHAL_4G136100 [Panicum hallii]